MEIIEHEATNPQTKQGIIEEIVGQELFLYDSDSDTAYCINSGAALVWFLCDGSRSPAAIAHELAATFAQAEQQVLADVAETVAQFQSYGLLQT